MSASGNGQIAEKLREFLRQLKPEARALLAAEFERAALRGAAMPGGDLVLRELRNASAEEPPPPQPTVNVRKLAFAPVEPFLVEEAPDFVAEGRLARAGVAAIWDWLCRDLVPAEAKAYADEVTRLTLANQPNQAGHATQKFQDLLVHRIESTLSEVRRDERQSRKLGKQIGTPHALEDVQRVAKILKQRSALTALAARMPMRIRSLERDQVNSIKSAIDSTAGSDRDLIAFGLAMAMGRLSAPWQLIRIAMKAAESDDPARIAESSYAVAATMVFSDLDRMVRMFVADLRRGNAPVKAELIQDIHDTVRGLRTELDLTGESPLARRLGQIRGELANAIKPKIDSLPGRVRRLLQPRGNADLAGRAGLAASDVADIESLLALTMTCRAFASELAINEITLRAVTELQQAIETSTPPLLEGLRHAGAADRPFRLSQLEAAVRVSAKVFGQEYASLLAKAVDVAASSQPKTQAKA